MNDLIEDIYRTETVRDADGEEINPFGTSIYRHQGVELYELVRQSKPARTMEIGMAYGLATLFMCQAHADNGAGGSHVVVDPFQRSKYDGIGLLNVERAGLDDRLEFREQFSHVALPELVAEGASFGVAFIDGSHLFDDAFIDFYYTDRMLTTGGYMVFDDVWMPAIRKVLRFAMQNRGYRMAHERPSLLRRSVEFWKGARKLDHGPKNVVRFSMQHLRRNPLDLGNWTSLLSFARRSGTVQCVLQKPEGGDERAWHHYEPF